MSVVDPFDWSLRSRVPGQSGMERVRALRAAGASEVLVHASERGLRGVRASEKIVRRLSDEWTVLHDVPVAGFEGHIDHLLISERGVFAVRVVHYPHEPVTVGGRSFTVAGEPSDLVDRAAVEGRHASQVLAEATGLPVVVYPVLLVVGTPRFSIESPPLGVFVAVGDEMLPLVESFPPVLKREAVNEVVMAAVQPQTWMTEMTLPWAVIPEETKPAPKEAVTVVAEAVAADDTPRWQRLPGWRNLDPIWLGVAGLGLAFVMYCFIAWWATAFSG